MRIYALAKELRFDSKELVDLCLKAGITGKGSALASLEDEEVTRLKAYLAGPTKKPVVAKAGDSAAPVIGAPIRPATEPAPFTRDDYLSPVPASSKIRVLDPKSKKPAVELKPATPTVTSPSPTTTFPQTITPSTIGEPERPAPEAPKPEPQRSAPQKRRDPVIVLSKLPDVKQPVVGQSRSNEPAAQKPEIRLPKDAIRGAKAGSRPPLEHLTARAERNKIKPGSPKPGGPKRPDAPQVVDAPLSKAASRTRRHKDGTPFTGPSEAEKELAGMASARADRQKARKTRQKGPLGAREEEDSLATRRRGRLIRRGVSTSTAAPRKERVSLALPCNVRAFSEATGATTGQILKTLMALGHPVNINAMVEQDLAELLTVELGLDIDFKARESLEHEVLAKLQAESDDPAALETRPPVVTFLGHVDHGKTSLLDRIIGIDVASKEAGGITQQIRAYQIHKNGRKISFVDTPGHEAFTEMRARGANVTDIAVLVVAADDGVMPQTEEAISHAKAANVPIVVALNKIDLPGANPDRVLQQLSAQGLTPSEWSGDVEVMRCSALTGEGMDDLLETLLVTADIHDYKANPHRPASGTCLEAEQEAGRGVIAKIMVKNGTLNVGDIIVCGPAHGRVKAMYDTLKPHTKVKRAGPSMPVNITGLDVPPNAGDAFFALNDITQAREIATQRATQGREQSLSGQTTKVSFDQFQRLLTEGRVGRRAEVATLNLIIRADMRGSIEAILKELGKFDHPEVQVKVLQASVGGITVGDVTLAYASNAVIIGFNVIPDEAARALAEERQIEIRRYEIIYKVADDIKAILEGKLKPEERIVELGQALVKQVFTISRVGTVAGCYVSRGTMERGCRMRVFRDGRNIGDYPMDSLRREKDDVKEVARGMECGIRLVNFHDVKQNDVLEAYKIEEVARTL